MSTQIVSVSRRRGPWRWLVAMLATALLVVSGSGLVAFAQSGAGASKGPAFVPSDAPIYVVARLDGPDGQMEAVAQLMSAFPGFPDPNTFGLKAAELMDGLAAQATGGAITTEDLAAFATGEVGLAVMDVAGAAMSGGDPELLLGIAISDRDAADAFVTLLTSSASGAVEEAYGNTSIISDGQMAIAVHDEWILASQSVDNIKAAIDVLEGDSASLADDPQFSTAFARVPSAHLAAAYVNLGLFSSIIELAGSAAAGQMGAPLDTAMLLEQLPKDMTAYLAASPDRLTLEAFVTPSEATMALPMGESDLASVFPADTQIYIETRELGTTLETALTQLLEQMDEETAAGMAPFEDMLGTSLPSFLDFVSDASIGASINSDGLWLGIAAEVTDEATAAIRTERLLSIVRAIGASAQGVSLEESTVNGSTVTTVTLPIDDAAGGAGMPIDIGNTISISVADGNLLIGTGDFVVDALQQDAASSLAASPGYTDALGSATSNAGVLYVNVGGLLTAVDPMISMMSPDWADIQPYATAIDRFIAVGNVDDVISTKMSVIVDS